MLRKFLMFGGFAMAMAFMVGTAKADPMTYTQTVTFGSGTATAYLTVSSGTATLTFGSDLNNYYTDEVAIQISGASLTGGSVFSGTTDISSDWTIQPGKNSVNCDGSGSWFCAKDSTSAVSLNGLSITWNFSNGDLTSPISIQFAICGTDAPDCAPSGTGNFLTNFSQSGPVSTPEPRTLVLLGAGLLPLLLFGHRFLG